MYYMDDLQCSQARVRPVCCYEQTSHMLKIGRKMTNIPDLSDLPIITRRYIEAKILKNVFDEIKKRFDS